MAEREIEKQMKQMKENKISPNSFNKELLKNQIILFLQQHGFTHIKADALSLLILELDCLIKKYFKSLSKHITFSERAECNFLNILTANSAFSKNYFSLFTEKNKTTNNEKNKKIIKYEEINLQKIIQREPTEWERHQFGEILTNHHYNNSNKTINDVVYFPPPHTFKKTLYCVDDDERNFQLQKLGKQRLAVKGTLVDFVEKEFTSMNYLFD